MINGTRYLVPGTILGTYKQLLLLLLYAAALENKSPTFDNLDRHARFSAAYREVFQAALRLRAPVLGAVHVDISKGVGLGPQALGTHLCRRRVSHSSR